MTTGEKIAECRKKSGMTQAQLAEALSVSRQAVSRWESDSAFPETDNLLKMSKLFGCSIDWLLKYGEEEPERQAEEAGGNFFDKIKSWFFEYKSTKTFCGLPLVHINIGWGRTATGVFAVGLKSKGLVSVGLLSAGILSLGTLSAGLVSLGALSLGLVSLGAVCLGLLALGGVAVGLVALGGLAVGLMSLGGCAVGGFSFGGYAYGSFAAIGDTARGGIALGGHSAQGSVCSYTVTEFADNRQTILNFFAEIPEYLSPLADWCKGIFEDVLNGSVTLGGINLQ